MPNRRLLVIDDSVTIRALIEQLFSAERSITIVGMCGSGESAIAEIEKFKPDVVTLDVMMPGIGGLAVLDFIMDRYPVAVVIVASSGHFDGELCKNALSKGASACFDKANIVGEAKRLRSTVMSAKKGRVVTPSLREEPVSR